MLYNPANETSVVGVNDSRIEAEMDPRLLFLLSVNW
jgi:hypothetical protein